jgi:erythromycin esterase
MRQLRERFEARREQYARAQGEEAFVWAARNARVLEQAVLQHARLGRASANLRDTFMAENARWVLEHEGPEAKMVLWAHDLHLMRENKNYIPLGVHLRDAFGEAFYMFRLAFNQGAFRAVLQPYGGSLEGLQTHVIEPAPEKTLEASLASMGQPLLALDLRAAPGEGEVAQYLDGPVQQREIGAAYTPGYPYLINVSPRFAFDGVLFVETTTASRPNPPLPPEAPSGP